MEYANLNYQAGYQVQVSTLIKFKTSFGNPMIWSFHKLQHKFGFMKHVEVHTHSRIISSILYRRPEDSRICKFLLHLTRKFDFIY